MRCLLIVCLWATLISLACDDHDDSVKPEPVPGVPAGMYQGTITYWAWIGTDSAETGTETIEFTFNSDSTYNYRLPTWDVCGIGNGAFSYEDGRLGLTDHTIWLALTPTFCIGGLLNWIDGQFEVHESGDGIVLRQKLPSVFGRREIRLEQVQG